MDKKLMTEVVEQMVMDSAANTAKSGFMVTEWQPPALSTIVDVCGGLAGMLGYRIDDLIGLSIWDITPECFYDDYEWVLGQFANGSADYFKCFKSRKGELVPVKLSVTMVDAAFGLVMPERGDSPQKIIAWKASITWAQRLDSLPYRNPPVQPYERRGGKILPFTPQLKR